MSTAHVVLDGVTARYRAGTRPALDGVDLELEHGERVSLIGPSGAGKTTLFRVLSGAVSPERGSVRLDGTDLSRLGPRALRDLRRGIGAIHQRGDLVAASTALTNVAMGSLAGRGAVAMVRLAAGRPPADVTRRALDALEELDVAECAGARVDELSGGQRQRVAVARLLVQRPALVLADEPTASVDPRSARIVLAALGRLVESGATLVLATHDVATARTGDRVLALSDGRVVFSDSGSALDPDALDVIYSAPPTPGRATRGTATPGTATPGTATPGTATPVTVTP